jgi:hypothetical protein
MQILSQLLDTLACWAEHILQLSKTMKGVWLSINKLKTCLIIYGEENEELYFIYTFVSTFLVALEWSEKLPSNWNANIFHCSYSFGICSLQMTINYQ